MKKYFNELKKYWYYIYYQSKSEIKSDIIDSRLGMLWLVLEPLAFMLIYTFIGEIVFNKTTEYFPIFIFAGLMLWNFFNNVIKKSTKLIKANKDIVAKIYVPKYVFLIISVCVNLFKLFITFLLLLVFMLVYQVPISVNILFVIPIILNIVIFTFGLSLFIMHFGVIITDLVNIMNILLKFLFYFTGIFYSIQEAIPAPYNNIIYMCNPMAYFITEFRNCFIYSTPINYIIYFVWLLIGLVLTYFGIKLVLKYENSYVKVMR